MGRRPAATRPAKAPHRVRLDGRVSDIKASYGKNTLILAFEGDGSFLKSLPGVASVNDLGRYAELRLGPGAEPQSLLKAASEKLKITRFEVVEPSLHDIFIERVTEVPA